jgi:predicted transcriptional regulator
MATGYKEIRDKDRVVLECIQEGCDDIQQITEATTLDNAAVNYCFRKLSADDFIVVEKPDGMVDRVIDGTRQVFEAPKQASLTGKGRKYLQQSDGHDDSVKYRTMTRDELIERVHELERTVEELGTQVDGIQQDVSNYLLDD